jgi:RHS repeat-associated protein
MEYDEFGRVLLQMCPSLSADDCKRLQPFGFGGGLHDPDTGLVRYGARDYDPQTGRWTVKDPIGFAAGSPLLYDYAGGDPVNRIDVDGLDYVEFNGQTLSWVFEGPAGQEIGRVGWPAASGAPGAPPLPEGTYQTGPGDKEFHPGFEAAWGPFSYRLHEGFLTRLRNRLAGRTGGFHIHGGRHPGTAGCVEFADYSPQQTSLQSFDALMQAYGQDVAVVVNYP